MRPLFSRANLQRAFGIFALSSASFWLGGAVQSQGFYSTPEYLMANPPPAITIEPKLPSVSTAEMFLLGCMERQSVYYSGRALIQPLQLQQAEPRQTPFPAIYKNAGGTLAGGETEIYHLRPEFDEFYVFSRRTIENGHEESCGIASSTITEISLLLDIQKVAPELGFEINSISESGGFVRLDISQANGETYTAGLGLTAANGKEYSWLMVGGRYP